jgi:hypothetical protein
MVCIHLCVIGGRAEESKPIRQITKDEEKCRAAWNNPFRLESLRIGHIQIFVPFNGRRPSDDSTAEFTCIGLDIDIGYTQARFIEFERKSETCHLYRGP